MFDDNAIATEQLIGGLSIPAHRAIDARRQFESEVEMAQNEQTGVVYYYCCDKCMGTGYVSTGYPFYRQVPCGHCRGTGSIYDSTTTAHTITSQCIHCKGTGRIAGDR